MPESSIVFDPEIDERELDKSVAQTNEAFNEAATDIPVSVDDQSIDGFEDQMQGATDGLVADIEAEMDALTGAGVGGGGGGIGGAAAGRAVAGGAGGAGAAGVGALASKIPKPIAGVAAAAALPVALAGGVGAGLLSAMQSSSARLQTSTNLLGIAADNFFRPIGDDFDKLLVRPVAKGILDTSEDFEELWESGKPLQALENVTTGSDPRDQTRFERAGGILGTLAGAAGGAYAGAKGGAIAGGAAGSIIPGAGTAAGSIGGAIVGGIVGALGGAGIGGRVGSAITNLISDIPVPKFPGWPSLPDPPSFPTLPDFPGWPELPDLPNWSDLKPDLPKWGDLKPDLPTWNTLTPTVPNWSGLLPDLPSWDSLTPDLPSWDDLTPDLPNWSDLKPFGGRFGNNNNNDDNNDDDGIIPGPIDPRDEGGIEFWSGNQRGSVVRKPTPMVAGEAGPEVIAPYAEFRRTIESVAQQSGGGGGGEVDMSSVERRLDDLNRNVQQLQSAMQVVVQLGNEEVARAAQEGQQNRLGDMDPSA